MEDTIALDSITDVTVHLVGQASVRYSLENPRSYIDTNVVGIFTVIEVAPPFVSKTGS